MSKKAIEKRKLGYAKENRERAKRAAKVLGGYSGGADDLESDIADLLADLRHLCDGLGLDFAELDKCGYRHYSAERVRAATWLGY